MYVCMYVYVCMYLIMNERTRSGILMFYFLILSQEFEIDFDFDRCMYVCMSVCMCMYVCI